jgi:gliding motility-associated-like protein
MTICEGDSVYLQGAYQLTSGSYQDTLKNIQLCDSMITTYLTVRPRIYFQQIHRICNGDSLYVEGAWQKTPGIYYDTLTSVTGCDSIVVTTLDIYPIVFHTIEVSLCEGIGYFAEGAWQTTSGLYIDTLLSFVGCDSIIFTNLTFYPNPVAMFSFSPQTTTIRNPKITFTDLSIGATSWHWNFGDPDSGADNISTQQHPQHTYSKHGSYTVWLVVTTPVGCTDSISMRVEIGDAPLIYVPNAFTPDGDGNNDVFIPKGYQNEWGFYEFTIYNRFGQMLFTTNDIFHSWDGVYKGELCPSGVYTWTVRVRYKTENQIITLSGTVHLLR